MTTAPVELEPRSSPRPEPAVPPPSLRRQILRFAVPGSLAVMSRQLFGLIDQIFVARLGEASFVAAGLTAQVLSLAFTILAALGITGSIRLARYAGAQDREGFSAAAAQTLQVTALLSVAVTAMTMLAAPAVFGVLGTALDVTERAVFFTRLVAASLPFMALIEIGNHALCARGDTRSPVVIGLAALAINSLLNYVFIFGWLGLPRLGLAGAGVATLIARGIGLVLVCWRLGSRRAPLRVRWSDLRRFQSARMGTLVRLAIPVALGQGAWLLGMMGYTRVYITLGTRELAAANVIGQLEGLCGMLSFGLGTACLILVGQALGRGDRDGAQKVAAECWRLARRMGVVTAIVLALVAMLVVPLYPRLEAGTQALVVLGLWISAGMQPIKVSNMLLAVGVLRGGGDVRFATMCELLLVVGVLCAWGLGGPLGLGLAGVLLGRGCEELLKLAVFSWRYASRRWMHELQSS